MGTAVIYCRISNDQEGEALGVARQEADCLRLAESRGLTVIETFTDNDLGASTRSRKKARPAYAEMMRRAETREFDFILSYSNSRLTRRPAELEEIIQLHERAGVRIATVVSGSADLATADGRQYARIQASIDAGEVERTAERVARKHADNAMTGKPVGGRRPFGWQEDKATINEEEAALIRKAADDIIAGVPLRQIAREWTELGVKTPSGPNSPGRDWSGTTISRMLRSPRLAGWRIHQRQVAIGRDGQPVRGQWEPILEQAKHDALVKALTRPERRSRIPRKGARHYLLTGVVRCGVCNGTMFGNRYDEGKHYYVCQGREGVRDHGLSISGHGTDAAITELVLARLADIDLDRPVPVFAGEQRLGQIEQQIGELMGAFSSGTLSAAVVFPQVSALEAERDELQAQRADLEAAAAGPKVGHVDRATWEAMDVHRRRAVIERVLDAVLIKQPTQRMGNRLDLDRIVPVWRTAE